ncbi:hypothetical protein HD553DRAFT_312843 [Filobasidium floriforme]|uniref:uncharacterized protein n=1 Tax=Filobasidium floriforme TaxID=5210 RepID=UPI001E8D91D6|nr:uncharacterized protein HD553DRAFT_312843 [Filobasidium floriforme]KAH8083641.1 hypothetical protein HD553DRAFT_312843 [Filobasidium floriforme]
MVEGEEIGLFGVWGWCVMNSDEIARCSAAKFGYTMDALVDDIGFTNFSKGLLQLPNGIFYAFFVHSLAVTLCGLALLLCVYHCWLRHLVNNSRRTAGWLQHGTILASALAALAAWIVDKLFVFFVKEKLKLDITRESSDHVVESGAIAPSVAAATCLLLWSFGMSLFPNLIVHLRRTHSFVRERERAVEDSLERGESATYLESQAAKVKTKSSKRSAAKRDTEEHVSRSTREKRRRRETLTKPARYRKREKQRVARRKAKRATLIQKRRSTWLPPKSDTDDDSGSDISVDDYDDIERRRLEKRWAKEEARKAATAGKSKSSAKSGGPARKAVRRLSTWYHGESDEEEEQDDQRGRRRRDTLGRRVSTWFTEMPQIRGKRSKGTRSRQGGGRTKKGCRDATDDEDDDDVDIAEILKLALDSPDKSTLGKDDISDDEFLEWTDDEVKDAGSGKKRGKYS